MRVLRRTLAGLVGDGVQQVTLVLSSSGGAIDPTLLTYSFIRSLPVRVDTHAAGFVQSSATALFLAGEGRTADRTARFMFHPWTVTQPAEASEQGVRESLARIEAVTEVELSILRDRTGLPEETLQRFRRGTVFLTAEQAREAGVVHAVADLRIPGGSQARIITLG